METSQALNDQARLVGPVSSALRSVRHMREECGRARVGELGPRATEAAGARLGTTAAVTGKFGTPAGVELASLPYPRASATAWEASWTSGAGRCTAIVEVLVWSVLVAVGALFWQRATGRGRDRRLRQT